MQTNRLIMCRKIIAVYRKNHHAKQINTLCKKVKSLNFMVTPCINDIHHFNNQLTHTTLKNVELLKHFKISKTAPTCFGLQGNNHQGATIST